MRIALCNPDGGAFHHIISGLSSAFRAIGIPCMRWSGQDKELRQFEPTLYIGATGWKQAIPPDIRRTIKVALHVNPYCHTIIKATTGPRINETVKNIQWAKAQAPDIVFGYGCQEDIDKYWCEWPKVVPLPTAGDSTIYYPEATREFNCDVAFIGGRWPYKATSIDKFLIPVLRKFNSKVYGWGGWGSHPYYRGTIKAGDDRRLLSSALVGPSISEPHTQVFGIDIPERIFKVPLCGTVTFCERIKGIERYFPKAIMPIAANQREYLAICEDLIKNKAKRSILAEKQRTHVLKHHTYFNRIAVLLKALGYNALAKKALERCHG